MTFNGVVVAAVVGGVDDEDEDDGTIDDVGILDFFVDDTSGFLFAAAAVSLLGDGSSFGAILYT